MSSETPRERFLASLSRCVRSEGFIPAFYRRLLDADEEIRSKFRFTEMTAQHVKLRKSLELCAAVTAGEPEALASLRDLGRRHDADHLDIRPEWYPIWLDTMLATASEYDNQWDAEIEDAWRRLLTLVTDRLASFYTPPKRPVVIASNGGWGVAASRG